MNRKQLVEEWRRSRAWLLANGYELVCSVVSGYDSGSKWIHKDQPNKKASILVRNGNAVSLEDTLLWCQLGK